ncbi:uncharacterized protein ATC70_012824 [Mucor velutinosus]|uniref:NADP-dependent oxidoreductase domain-containing protein n=1 Tax=Mucor velutinosus TaxID=708070 RepID=A0AAN7D649_9FUNG|nr:hypothetical protein ATC70_012824 [Mucor velutinosus]
MNALHVEEIISDSIKQGYRLIITIFNDDNDVEVGKCVTRAITDGIVKREELLIVGQLWSSYRQKQHIKPVLQMALDNLGLDYIDLYLVQFSFATEYIDLKQFSPESEETNKLKLASVSLEETWRELEALVDAGVIRNLGISHFNFQSVIDLLRYARIRPRVLEIEHHPYFQQKKKPGRVGSL